MSDDRSDPTKNSDAARNQANSDFNNGSLPANTYNWDNSARESYERQWKYNNEKNG